MRSLIDAFDATGKVPTQLGSEEMFRTLTERRGFMRVVAMNVMVGHDLDMQADRIALNMEAAGFRSVLFDRHGRSDRNVIIAGASGRG
jgi:hypothetical protein